MDTSLIDFKEEPMILFAEQEDNYHLSNEKNAWKILIIDDDKDVHLVTKMVLKETRFEGAELDLLHAYSAEEAKAILLAQHDIAVAFVDVVMETDQAGLILIDWIRTELDNHKIRLILRTGQPGVAPEEKVIQDYNINDYKAKSELSSLKLKTSVISALRAYQDLTMLESAQVAVETMLDATGTGFNETSLNQYSLGIMQQIMAMLAIKDSSRDDNIHGCFVVNVHDYHILHSYGIYANRVGDSLSEGEIFKVQKLLNLQKTANDKHQGISENVEFVLSIKESTCPLIFYFHASKPISTIKKTKIQSAFNKSVSRLLQLTEKNECLNSLSLQDHEDELLQLEQLFFKLIANLEQHPDFCTSITSEFKDRLRLALLARCIERDEDDILSDGVKVDHQTCDVSLDAIFKRYGLSGGNDEASIERLGVGLIEAQILSLFDIYYTFNDWSDKTNNQVLSMICGFIPSKFNPVIANYFIELFDTSR